MAIRQSLLHEMIEPELRPLLADTGAQYGL